MFPALAACDTQTHANSIALSLPGLRTEIRSHATRHSRRRRESAS
jgi:hypothetical protein